MSVLLLIAVLVPAAAAVAVAGGARSRSPRAQRRSDGTLLAAATGLAFGAVVAVTAGVLAGGPVSAVLARGDGRAVTGLVADRASAVLLLLVLGVAAVVQLFAVRYLRGDVRATRFAVLTGLLTSATAATVCAATLVGLALAWSLAGLVLLALLGLYAELPAAREGVRRTAVAFAIGDGALWLGVAVALVAWGDLDLRRLAEQAPLLTADTGVLAVVTLAVVVAALARSAQLPLQRWLPATLAAPTPVSALLHAGVVNAGGILLIRTAPLFGASALATHLAFAAGAATTIYGTTLMLVKPDVKGALAHSTMGQMGFMVMTCGLGAFAAALFHLVAHGMYKATLFLGSGAAVHRHLRHLTTPPAHVPAGGRRRMAAVAAALLPALVVVGAVAVLHPRSAGDAGTALLLVFGWAAAARGAWGWIVRHPSARGTLTAGGAVLLAAPLYVALVRGASDLLRPSVAQGGPSVVSVWWLGPVVCLLLLASLIRLAAATGRLQALHERLWVWALAAGHVGGRAGRPPGRRRTPHGVTLQSPVLAGLEGGRA